MYDKYKEMEWIELRKVLEKVKFNNIKEFAEELERLRLEDIQQRAYFKWLDAGSPPGDGQQFWIEAEKEWQETEVDRRSKRITYRKNLEDFHNRILAWTKLLHDEKIGEEEWSRMMRLELEVWAEFVDWIKAPPDCFLSGKGWKR